MRWSDIIKMCLDSLRRRKGRTILTVLGVFIGCVSIIVMISIGAGMRESQDQMIANMGDVTIIEVYSGGEEAKLDDDAVESFRNIAGVSAVMPKKSLDYGAALKAGPAGRYYTDWASVVGIDTSALDDMGYTLAAGEYPQKGEVLVGEYFAYDFYDSLMPEGKNYIDRWVWDEEAEDYSDDVPDPFFNPLTAPITMTLNSYDDASSVLAETELKVAGIAKEDYGKGWETSSGIMMDIEDMRELIKKADSTQNTKFEYSEVYVKAGSIDEVLSAEQEIQTLGFSTYSMQSVREELQKQTRQIELMLGGLGAISLLVAAIGITNTMTMSVSERTKEIGIMKSIGCYVGDIRKLFLLEAGSIGLIGGIFGLLFSVIVSVVINLFSFGAFGGGGITWELLAQALFGGEGVARISVVSLPLAVFALLFSLFVGLVSGYHPANKAVKIPALEAIRSE